MRELPKSHFDRSLLLRTDFSDENAWEALCEATRTPSRDGFVARFNLVSDAIFADIGIEELLEIQPNDAKHDFLFVADAECLANSEYPILVVDLYAEPGRSFRVVPSVAWEVENNLSIANIDFEEFADQADLNGVFRGFYE